MVCADLDRFFLRGSLLIHLCPLACTAAFARGRTVFVIKIGQLLLSDGNHRIRMGGPSRRHISRDKSGYKQDGNHTGQCRRIAR